MSTYANKYKQIAERLSKLPEVTRYDKGEHKEAWDLAHSFLDLEESFTKYKEDHLPKLTKQNLSDKELNDALLDIGEEFRHILYHIANPKFYEYLFPEDKNTNKL